MDNKKKQEQLGSSLPKTKLHTEWSIHPGCFGRPHQFSPVPFSCLRLTQIISQWWKTMNMCFYLLISIYIYICHYISIYQISGSLPRVPGTPFHLHLSQSEKQHWTNKGENGISPPNLQHQYATWPRLQAKSQQTMESAVCRRHSGAFFVWGLL